MGNRPRRHSLFYGWFGAPSSVLVAWTAKYSMGRMSDRSLNIPTRLSTRCTKDVLRIQRVQRAATKMVAGLTAVDYETRLAVFDLFPLEYRRLRGDPILTYALKNSRDGGCAIYVKADLPATPIDDSTLDEIPEAIWISTERTKRPVLRACERNMTKYERGHASGVHYHFGTIELPLDAVMIASPDYRQLALNSTAHVNPSNAK
ncbi:pol-related protein [Clonorchis sinensis]|uniref:Pol-related protein n=1 Tax=Clonorchis sinensis TaxID=79923 RepID=G7YD65_CLOSI|nr:pol-related protein [Clonorchis sinensis]